MGFPIPEPYCWDESFAVFYQNLDDEHKGLFTGIFDVAADKSSAGALSTLVDRVKKHFANEEGMMQAAKYAEYPEHKKMHEDFVAKITALHAPVDQATVDFAKDWLVQHIKSTDHKYKGKL